MVDVQSECKRAGAGLQDNAGRQRGARAVDGARLKDAWGDFLGILVGKSEVGVVLRHIYRYRSLL